MRYFIAWLILSFPVSLLFARFIRAGKGGSRD
jgi:hypothetical protein